MMCFLLPSRACSYDAFFYLYELLQRLMPKLRDQICYLTKCEEGKDFLGILLLFSFLFLFIFNRASKEEDEAESRRLDIVENVE